MDLAVDCLLPDLDFFRFPPMFSSGNGDTSALSLMDDSFYKLAFLFPLITFYSNSSASLEFYVSYNDLVSFSSSTLSKFLNFGTGGLLLFDPSLAFGGRLPPSFLAIDVD